MNVKRVSFVLGIAFLLAIVISGTLFYWKNESVLTEISDLNYANVTDNFTWDMTFDSVYGKLTQHVKNIDCTKSNGNDEVYINCNMITQDIHLHKEFQFDFNTNTYVLSGITFTEDKAVSGLLFDSAALYDEIRQKYVDQGQTGYTGTKYTELAEKIEKDGGRFSATEYKGTVYALMEQKETELQTASVTVEYSPLPTVGE